MRVLMIEDSPFDATLVQTLLAGAEGPRFEVEHRERLGEGLMRLADGGIDAVLLDLTLPDSVGLDTFQQAHRRFPDVPILVVTGMDDMEGGAGSRASGSDRLLGQRADRSCGVGTRHPLRA